MKSPYYYLLAFIFLVACQNKTQQTNEHKITSKMVQSSHFFSGTKMFCSQSWNYMVTIEEDNIIIKSYPAASNDSYSDKTKAHETVIGKIKDDKIITQVESNYLTNRFKYENGVFYEINVEGGNNEYVECDINSSSDQNNEITIKYSTPINGYNVSVKWLIKGKLNNVNGSDNLSGPAILTFEKISTKEISWVIHPEFTIAIDKENFNNITFKDGDFVKNKSFTQISNYIKPKFKRVGTSKEEEGYGYTYIPFFFQDVDFDDKDELILTYATTYGKGGSINKIFKITDYDGVEFSEMTNEPFTSFRGFYFGNPSADHYGYTIINYDRKSITRSGLVGAGGQYSSIYEFKKSEYGGGYQLYKKTEINLNMAGYGRTDGTIAYFYDDNGEVLSINKMK